MSKREFPRDLTNAVFRGGALRLVFDTAALVQPRAHISRRSPRIREVSHRSDFIRAMVLYSWRMKKALKCPTCKKAGNWFEGKYGPFCSHRCRLIDLGKWLGEEHAVSSPLRPEHL